MLKIGLTGGIGSGKSAVANCFAEFGIEVIDSDLIARQLTDIDEPAYYKILNRYGERVLTPTKQINRRKLREIVFSSKEERQWLENILHPLIKHKINEQALKSLSPYCLVVIPLLVETKSYDLVDRILVVDSSVENQIERTLARDAQSKQSIQDIIDVQATREERNEMADDIIYNNSTLEQVKEQVATLHKLYLELTRPIPNF